MQRAFLLGFATIACLLSCIANRNLERTWQSEEDIKMIIFHVTEITQRFPLQFTAFPFQDAWRIEAYKQRKICKVLSGIIYVLLFLLEKTCKYKELENGATKINYSGTHNKSNMRIKV